MIPQTSHKLTRNIVYSPPADDDDDGPPRHRLHHVAVAAYLDSRIPIFYPDRLFAKLESNTHRRPVLRARNQSNAPNRYRQRRRNHGLRLELSQPLPPKILLQCKSHREQYDCHRRAVILRLCPGSFRRPQIHRHPTARRHVCCGAQEARQKGARAESPAIEP